MSFIATGVSYEVEGRLLVDQVNLRVERGQIHALLGPNGAGKSTLLRLLAKEITATRGTIELNGRPLPFWTGRDLARQRAVLPQAHGLAFGFTARQVVALGRLPCPQHRVEREEQIAREALALAGVALLAERSYPTLSGGERARVQFARVMAQVWEPLEGGDLEGRRRFLLLDEPTANLDLAHQHDCLAAVRTLVDRGLGALVILHDPNLALRYADAVTLLRGGRVVASGPPRATMTSETLEKVYRVPVRLVRAEGEDTPIVVVSQAPRNARPAP
jgi:iron complex transport system ATP-binding protein